MTTVVADLLAASEAYERGQTFAFRARSWRRLRGGAAMEYLALRASHRVVALSQWMVDGLASWGVHREKLRLSYPGSSQAEPLSDEERRATRAAYRIATDAFLVTFLGAFTRRKNAQLLLTGLVHTPPSVHAVLIGAGPCEARLRNLAADSGMAERVHFAGWLNEPSRLLAACDALCHPATYETFGLVYLEALSNGVPILGPYHAPPVCFSAAPEIVREGCNGMLFDLRAPRCLGAAIDSMAMPDTHVRLASGAAPSVAGWTWEAHVRGFGLEGGVT